MKYHQARSDGGGHGARAPRPGKKPAGRAEDGGGKEQRRFLASLYLHGNTEGTEEAGAAVTPSGTAYTGQVMPKLHSVLNLMVLHEDHTFWCLVLGARLAVRCIWDFLSSGQERQREWRKRYWTHRARLEIISE